MKMTIEIPDKEIVQEVRQLLVRRLADQLFKDRDNLDKRQYQKMLKEAVKECLAGRIDVVTDQAVTYATDYIGRKGVKKLVERFGEASGNA